jgi:hypothetical protein
MFAQKYCWTGLCTAKQEAKSFPDSKIVSNAVVKFKRPFILKGSGRLGRAFDFVCARISFVPWFENCLETEA